MQFDEIKDIREKWGDKPCDHPNIEKEYMLGAQTGDYVCTQCGITNPKREDFKNLRGQLSPLFLLAVIKYYFTT